MDEALAGAVRLLNKVYCRVFRYGTLVSGVSEAGEKEYACDGLWDPFFGMPILSPEIAP